MSKDTGLHSSAPQSPDRKKQSLSALFAGEAPTLATVRESGLYRGAFLAAFAENAVIRKRASRQGLVLLYTAKKGLLAALLFQDRLHAWLELPLGETLSPVKDQAAFLSWLLPALDDFRLGWLPQEKLRGLGGAVYRAQELPPEAEGFMPLYAAGCYASVLRGHGILLDDRTIDSLWGQHCEDAWGAGPSP